MHFDLRRQALAQSRDYERERIAVPAMLFQRADGYDASDLANAIIKLLAGDKAAQVVRDVYGDWLQHDCITHYAVWRSR